jgi:hypothetical protein
MSLFKILKLSIFLLCNENISWNELYICFQIIFFSFVLNDNEENRHLIAKKVNDLGIIPTKLAQWMGYFLRIHFENKTRFKLFINCLPYLQSHCSVKKSKLYNYYVDKYSSIVKEVDKEAFASASIAQIYRGKTINGDEIVMKIRHDGILNNIQRWENIFSSIMKYFKLNININHFFQNIREQIDFTKEAENLQLYHKIYRKNHLVQIPQYYGGDTDVLIMSYIASENFQEIKHSLTNEEIEYYTILSRIIYQDNIFIKDVIHMDLHNGNWGINRSDKSIVLYDFGWVLKDQSDFKKFFILAHIGRIETLEFFLEKYNLRDNTGEIRTFVDRICQDKTIDTLHGVKLILKLFPENFIMDNFLFCVLSLCVFISSLSDKLDELEKYLSTEIEFMEENNVFIPLCSLMKKVHDPDTKEQLKQWYSRVENSPNRDFVQAKEKIIKID